MKNCKNINENTLIGKINHLKRVSEEQNGLADKEINELNSKIKEVSYIKKKRSFVSKMYLLKIKKQNEDFERSN